MCRYILNAFFNKTDNYIVGYIGDYLGLNVHQGIKIGKASAVLAASIFHFGEHTILEAKQYLDSKGIPVRI